MITIGSLFSGIGGFELGLERAIPSSKTIWQVEQNKYCHTILSKHWPDAKIYDDVRDITKDNVSPVDILCGGFPCQDISIAGKKGGIHAEKSGLWWEMLRIIGELRPRIAVLENVPNIIRLGGRSVVGSLASIGYDSEWSIISANQFGAPHRRKRWFLVAYSTKSDGQKYTGHAGSMETERRSQYRSCQKTRVHVRNYWEKGTTESPLCSVDDGIPDRLARLRALGNAIVPQCSEWIGEQIVKSGLLEDV